MRAARRPAARIPTSKVSALEAKFDQIWRLLRPAWAPLPVAEHRFAPPRRWRFDRAFPTEMVAVELEGGVWSGGRHTRAAGFLGDVEKYNAAALANWLVLRFTAADLPAAQAVVDQVVAALKMRRAA